MADEPVQTNDSIKRKSRKPALINLAIVAAIMLLEGAGVYVLTRFLSPSPSTAKADTAEGGSNGEASGDEQAVLGRVEVDLATCRLTSRTGAKAYTISVRLTGLVRPADKERAEAMIAEMRARVDDRVNCVIRGAAQSQLNEPGLDSIKRQLESELEQIFGVDDLLLEVLVPELLITASGV